ncbi:MAG: hypothetical protein KF712_17290 [Akkermansiaceae bacterium]|nr:hypothetical protein [Akkermansiaceae bacterium]
MTRRTRSGRLSLPGRSVESPPQFEGDEDGVDTVHDPSHRSGGHHTAYRPVLDLEYGVDDPDKNKGSHDSQGPKPDLLVAPLENEFPESWVSQIRLKVRDRRGSLHVRDRMLCGIKDKFPLAMRAIDTDGIL